VAKIEHKKWIRPFCVVQVSKISNYHQRFFPRFLSNFQPSPFKMSKFSKHELFNRAAAHGDLATVDRLLADPEVDPNNLNFYAIEYAVHGGHTAVVRRLLADPRMYDHMHVSRVGAMRRSLTWNMTHDEIVRGLMSTHLYDAAHGGHVDLVKFLLKDRRVDPSLRERDDSAMAADVPLTAAAQEGHAPVVRLLLKDARVDPGLDNNKALWAACRGDHVKIVDMLLNDTRVDPSAGGTNKPIESAATNDNWQILCMLIKHKPVYTSALTPRVRSLVEPALCDFAWHRRRHAVLARARRAAGL
jgi:ankyrin repeat protein